MTDTIDVAALVERLRAVDQYDDHDTYKNAPLFIEAATALQSQADALATMQDALESADLQIHYLHEKLGNETGSGNAVLAQIRAAKEGK